MSRSYPLFNLLDSSQLDNGLGGTSAFSAMVCEQSLSKSAATSDQSRVRNSEYAARDHVGQFGSM